LSWQGVLFKIEIEQILIAAVLRVLPDFTAICQPKYLILLIPFVFERTLDLRIVI